MSPVSRRSLFVGLTLLGLAAVAYPRLASSPAREHSSDPHATTVRRTDPAVTRELGASLDEFEALYTDARGFMSQADTEALKARRAAASATIVARIGAGGPEIVPAVRDALRATERPRDKLVLIAGLGRNPSAEAVAALEELYAEQDLFRVKEEALRSLGESEGPGHARLLATEMVAAKDERLAQIAAMSLYGDGEATQALIAAVWSDRPMNVRLEAISSLGGVGTVEARSSLEQIADSGEIEARVAQYAAHVLRRERG